MGECFYCEISCIITYGQYQCCAPMHNDFPKDFCLFHANYHIELHPSHKEFMTDKSTLLNPIKRIFGGTND